MKQPNRGDVWQYEYLWRREHEAGAETGRKPRPTALVTTFVGKDGRTNLFLLAITSKEPGKDRLAMEIPQMERKRARLASDMRLWIILDEYNHDFLETSFYLDPNGKQGAFSSAFTEKALGRFIETARQGNAKMVPRHDG